MKGLLLSFSIVLLMGHNLVAHNHDGKVVPDHHHDNAHHDRDHNDSEDTQDANEGFVFLTGRIVQNITLQSIGDPLPDLAKGVLNLWQHHALHSIYYSKFFASTKQPPDPPPYFCFPTLHSSGRTIFLLRAPPVLA